MKREPAPLAMSPYGDFDTMLGTVVKRLASSPFLLGDTFSAADLLWGMALQWGTMFKIVPENPVITDYVKRVSTRPSVVEVAAMDAEWVVEHERAAKEINS
jgi:glutathione S-transferase